MDKQQATDYLSTRQFPRTRAMAGAPRAGFSHQSPSAARSGALKSPTAQPMPAPDALARQGMRLRQGINELARSASDPLERAGLRRALGYSYGAQ